MRNRYETSCKSFRIWSIPCKRRTGMDADPRFCLKEDEVYTFGCEDSKGNPSTSSLSRAVAAEGGVALSAGRRLALGPQRHRNRLQQKYRRFCKSTAANHTAGRGCDEGERKEAGVLSDPILRGRKGLSGHGETGSDCLDRRTAGGGLPDDTQGEQSE